MAHSLDNYTEKILHLEEAGYVSNSEKECYYHKVNNIVLMTDFILKTPLPKIKEYLHYRYDYPYIFSIRALSHQESFKLILALSLIPYPPEV